MKIIKKHRISFAVSELIRNFAAKIRIFSDMAKEMRGFFLFIRYRCRGGLTRGKTLHEAE